MRSTRPLNRTFRYNAKKQGKKVVSEKHFRKLHAEKKPVEVHPEKKSLQVHTKCPHCGKSIAITIK